MILAFELLSFGNPAVVKWAFIRSLACCTCSIDDETTVDEYTILL
jgi:hypothetical protein